MANPAPFFSKWSQPRRLRPLLVTVYADDGACAEQKRNSLRFCSVGPGGPPRKSCVRAEERAEGTEFL